MVLFMCITICGSPFQPLLPCLTVTSTVYFVDKEYICMVCTCVWHTLYQEGRLWNIYSCTTAFTYSVQLRIALLGSPQQLAVSSDVLWPLELLPLLWDVFSWVWDEAEDLHVCKQKQQQQGLYIATTSCCHSYMQADDVEHTDFYIFWLVRLFTIN